jgi:hypothetical protein
MHEAVRQPRPLISECVPKVVEADWSQAGARCGRVEPLSELRV